MPSSHLVHTVSADSLQGTITISQPEISWEKARDLVDQWLAKQDQFWPQDLTHDVLLDGIEYIYAAHWILSGAASGNWSASIGVDRKITEICPKRKCRGTGRLVETNGDLNALHARPRWQFCASPDIDCRGTTQKTV